MLKALCWDWATLLRHPLVIALVQLVVGGLIGAAAAYFLTERWQRWRQEREFKYRAMIKFNELSFELAERMAELLVAKATIPHLNVSQLDVDPGKRRELISRSMMLEAMRDELAAIFSEDIVMSFDRLRQRATDLKDRINTSGRAVTLAEVEPVQDRFLAQRQATAIRMMGEMGGFIRRKKDLRNAARDWDRKAAAGADTVDLRGPKGK